MDEAKVDYHITDTRNLRGLFNCSPEVEWLPWYKFPYQDNNQQSVHRAQSPAWFGILPLRAQVSTCINYRDKIYNMTYSGCYYIIIRII